MIVIGGIAGDTGLIGGDTGYLGGALVSKSVNC